MKCVWLGLVGVLCSVLVMVVGNLCIVSSVLMMGLVCMLSDVMMLMMCVGGVLIGCDLCILWKLNDGMNGGLCVEVWVFDLEMMLRVFIVIFEGKM